MFETLLNLSNASTCSGDSGGPLVQQFGKISAAIGVVSGGSTQVLAGICVATGNDSSFYVDLQSTSSQAFLFQFADIQFVSGRLIEFKTKADKAIKTCGSVIRAKDFPTLVKNFNALAKAVNQLNRLADGRRRAVLKKIISTLNSAATVRTKREFTRELNNVQNLLRKLSGMGVS
jgi:hypothetical protein